MLTAQDLAALDGRTEGWIAALQLAALSMQGRGDVSAFIAGFAGDDRYIVDYLAEEVLARQPRRHPGLPAPDLNAIPDEVVRVRPVLAVGFIGALMAGGEFEGVERRLQDVERWLEPAGDGGGTWVAPAGMVVVDQSELPRLPGAIEMYRAGLALVRGDVPATLGHARAAMDRAVDGDHLVRAAASALSGLALWGGGDLEAAHRAYSVCVEGLQRAGHLSDVLGCSITLADIRITQGRLGDALRTYEQALLLGAHDVGPVLRGTADMYVGLTDRLRA